MSLKDASNTQAIGSTIVRACRSGLIAMFISAAATLPAAAWETAHGPTDNTGFVDVPTAPAKSPVAGVPIGDVAPGAGPVIAPDGTIYIGTRDGRLSSFKPDGTPGWSRDVGPNQTILASPAIGSDGTIYVVSVKQSTDHRVDPPVERFDATLHRFSPGGAYLGPTQFPEHNGGGGSTASPNLWRFNGTELVIAPGLYHRPAGGGFDIRLLAFARNGTVAVDQRAASVIPEASGGSTLPEWFYPICIVPVLGQLGCYGEAELDIGSPKGTEKAVSTPALAGVSIFVNPRGGTPGIALSDQLQDVVGGVLSNNSFVETSRVHDNDRLMRSPPTFLPDSHVIVGAQDIDRSESPFKLADSGGALFGGPNKIHVAPVTGLSAILAAPTRMPDGRIALVGKSGQLVVLSGGAIAASLALAGESVASAAASRTHLFVSTEAAFQTFDPKTLTEVARLDWEGGGRSPPVIGPNGQVYAIAGNVLYVFPGPTKVAAASDADMSNVTVGHLEPGTQSENSHAYKPPLLTDGNRLFACEKLDGDDCGKGDYNTIATAFCKKEGFVGAGHIEVDNKKVKAETLDGQYCSKKKCKVFDQIICANN